MATPIKFRGAVKYDAKARVALVGPPGSGKSYTMLELACLLAGIDPEAWRKNPVEEARAHKIAAIDTERGSLSKYADLFDFDVVELDSFSPENFQAAHSAAVESGYVVFLTDSLSHFWVGKDGALEWVDSNSRVNYGGGEDKFGSGWKKWRPHERKMVDTMTGSPMHVIVTMRTKTEYQEVERNGKRVRVKVGLQPVQREGLEYEMDLVGYMDPDENTMVVDKTRCPAYTGKAIVKPSAKDWLAYKKWLSGAKPEPRPATPAPTPTGNGDGLPPEVAARKQTFTSRKAIREAFSAALSELTAAIGEGPARAEYAGILGEFAVSDVAGFKNVEPAWQAYLRLLEAVKHRRDAASVISDDDASLAGQQQAPKGPYTATDDDLPPILRGSDQGGNGASGNSKRGLRLDDFDSTQRNLFLMGTSGIGWNRAKAEAFLGTFDGTVADALGWANRELARRQPKGAA